MWTKGSSVKGGYIHRTHILSQPFEVVRLDVPPVEQDGALADVVEALDETHNGALPAATLPHQGHRLAGGDGQVEVAVGAAHWGEREWQSKRRKRLMTKLRPVLHRNAKSK